MRAVMRSTSLTPLSSARSSCHGPWPLPAPRTRFACLVAARNEEAVIGALVESLKKQDYPDALYDIFVIPNNCTDDTEAAEPTSYETTALGSSLSSNLNSSTDCVDWLTDTARQSGDLTTIEVADSALAENQQLMETLIQHYGRTCRRYRFQVLYPAVGYLHAGRIDMGHQVFAATLNKPACKGYLRAGQIHFIQHVYGASLPRKES